MAVAKRALEDLTARGDIDGAFVLVIRNGARGGAIIAPGVPLDTLIEAAAESLDELYTQITQTSPAQAGEPNVEAPEIPPKAP
jgi:hypothetical protein